MSPRKDYTVAEKLEIYSEYKESGVSIRDFCQKKNLSKSVLQRIIRNRTALTLIQEKKTYPITRKRARQASFDDIDEALFRWFQIARADESPPTGHQIRSKAEKFASSLGYEEWHCSDGWFSRWKKRHSISYKVRNCL